jgi:alkylation response protein AidB-like acyl-CoA dehydrogenase
MTAGSQTATLESIQFVGGDVATPVERAIALKELVRKHADASEAQRHLASEVAEAFAASGLYRIAAPKDHFGSEEDPLTQVETIEAIAQADGSAAWNLMIGIETFGLVAPGFVQCRELIEDPGVVLCSSTAAVGRADKVDGGYRVSGRWQFVSGCHNAQIFGATVRVWEDGERVESLPNRYAVITQPDWRIIDTWHTGGLCGSGSHDVEVDDVFVPQARLTAPIGGAQHDSALLNFPLGSRLAYNKVAVAWGLTRAGIDAFVELAQGKQPRFSARGLKDRPRAQRAVAEAEVRFRSGRAFVIELLQQMWETVQARGHVTSKDRGLFQLACSDAVRGCRQAVDTIAEAAGTTANQKSHPLERIVRDIRVVGQHVTVAPHNIEDAGRLLLGLPAQEMMLAGLQSSD